MNDVPDSGNYLQGTSGNPMASGPEHPERGRPSGGRILGIAATAVVLLGILGVVILL